MKSNQLKGHLLSVLTAVVWGVTFISTKVLLNDFSPTEILFFRTLLAVLALVAIRPRLLKFQGWRKEAVFMLAGLSGVCLYHLVENVAISYTQASNVSVVVSAAPFFTALMAREERPRRRFYIGFAAAMIGIGLMSFSGVKLKLNPLGDVLALTAAGLWAVYSVMVKKIGGYGVETIQSTKRILEYGLLFMLPSLWLFDFHPEFSRMIHPTYLLNILFLGLVASALCLVTWNFAVKTLGAVKTSVYIYLIPVVTVAAGAIVLKEKLTMMSGIGIALTLAGLFISEIR